MEYFPVAECVQRANHAKSDEVLVRHSQSFLALLSCSTGVRTHLLQAHPRFRPKLWRTTLKARQDTLHLELSV
jgi:hypothetical protein